MSMLLPTTNFFGTQVTKVIIGDNPMTGHSYIQDRITGEEMASYYTQEKVVEALFTAVDAGFNTLLPLACPKMIAALKEFRRLGGKMNLVFQPYPAHGLAQNIEEMMACDPIAIYHQGTTTDYLTETDQVAKIHENMKLLHATGLPIGLATHVPATVRRAEAEDWGVDFYMFCLYNARRNRLGEPSGFITGKTKADLVFCPDDRFDAYEVIKSVQKPFIAYKVFAGGQIFTGFKPEEYPAVAEKYMKELFGVLKPTDVCCIGVLQRDFDQLRQNAEIARRLLV